MRNAKLRVMISSRKERGNVLFVLKKSVKQNIRI
jgi:hypothetical protein